MSRVTVTLPDLPTHGDLVPYNPRAHRDALSLEATCRHCGNRIWHAPIEDKLYCACLGARPGIKLMHRRELAIALHERQRAKICQLAQT